jgi:hypothetical protein
MVFTPDLGGELPSDQFVDILSAVDLDPQYLHPPEERREGRSRRSRIRAGFLDQVEEEAHVEERPGAPVVAADEVHSVAVGLHGPDEEAVEGLVW